MLADIDGDGKVEALLSGNHGGLFAWELSPAAGDTFQVRQEKGWPLPYGENAATAAVADVDDDGFRELAVAVDDGWVYLYDLPGLESGSVPWPVGALDNQRTGDLGNYSGAMRGGQPGGGLGMEAGAGEIRVSPNPFNPTATIRYRVPQPTDVEMVVYDVAGRQVRELVHTRQSAGIHEVIWDGRTDHGHVAPSGVYLLRGRIGAFEQSRRIVVAK